MPFNHAYPIGYSSDMAVPIPFSKRHGFVACPELIREDAPVIVRHHTYEFLSSIAREHNRSSVEAAEEAHQLICKVLHRVPTTHEISAWRAARKLLETCEWYYVYDVLEALYKIINNGTKKGRAAAETYAREVNDILQNEGIGWRMKNGELLYRGSESFEKVVETTKNALGSAGKKTAREEIDKALEDLSRRPSPDLTGAVHHAIGALECVAADMCGAKGKTLGQIVKRHPDKFPPPLGEVVSKLYGFASEKGRHITEGGEPNMKEVELVVGIAATVATYLTR